MSATEPTTLSCVELVSSLDAAAQARVTVREALTDADGETVDRAILLVDEVVASALMSVGAPLQLVVERHVSHLVVEVVAAAPAQATRDCLVDELGPAQVVLDAWAADWGATDSSIWFSLPTAAISRR